MRAGKWVGRAALLSLATSGGAALAQPRPPAAPPPPTNPAPKPPEPAPADPNAPDPAALPAPRIDLPTALVVCPARSERIGDQCIATEVVCPVGSTRIAGVCLGEIRCPEGTTVDGTRCVAPDTRLANPNLLAGGVMLLSVGVTGIAISCPFLGPFCTPFIAPVVAGIPMIIVGAGRKPDAGSPTKLRNTGLMVGGVVLAGVSLFAIPVGSIFVAASGSGAGQGAGATVLALGIAMGAASVPMWIIGGARVPVSASTTPTFTARFSVGPLGAGLEGTF